MTLNIKLDFFLPPLVASVLALVITKGIFVAIFPAPSVDDDSDAKELWTAYVHSEPNLGLEIYDTFLGLCTFAVLLAIYYSPWSKWVGEFPYSKLVIAHLIVAVIAYCALVVAPYSDTYFKEQMDGDWFLLAKRMSLMIGWAAILLVEFCGKDSNPSHWTSHIAALILSLNILEGAILGFTDLKQYFSSTIFLCLVPFAPMIYVDRERSELTATTDYSRHAPFFACLYRKNPFSVRWFYRLYCVALLPMNFLPAYFSTYGLMPSLTMALPLLTAEVKSFHSEPDRRFETYTEVFFLLRVSPLWVNSVMGLALREVWLSYVDGSYTGRFSFVVENVFLRNVIDIVWLVSSILLLRYRDKQEDRHTKVRREEDSWVDGGQSPASDSAHGEESSVVGDQPAFTDSIQEDPEEGREGPHRGTMQRRFSWAYNSALGNEEKVEEAHEGVVVASVKEVGIENGVNDEMLDKDIDMEGPERAANNSYLSTSLEAKKENRGNNEEMAKIKDGGRGMKGEKEEWEQFLLFRDMLKSVSNNAGNKGTANDDAHEDGDSDKKKNTPQSKGDAGHGHKESDRKAIDPPSDYDNQALVRDRPGLGSEGKSTMLSWLTG